ncbi:MAG: HNH endonuclease family protein [Pleurocapsa minor GSE-CHR-MK-17-07R]|jgi:hypothetical protein|nr:HNH endonuclease family protein [Pleurocapsa minor GSE-CHR-MK 17-07R]
MVLEAVDLHMMTNRQERIHIQGDLTIEHVYPQTPEHGAWLPLENPALVHTIGNLTLLTSALNSSISNGPFKAKCPEIARQSSLRMNAYFQQMNGKDDWDAADIQARGQQLYEIALLIWPRPAQQASIRLTPGQQRAIDSLCDIADQHGIGPGFRTLLDAAMCNALYPRVEASSIMVAPQSDKNRALFTVWANPKDDGLKVYVVTDAFSEVFAISSDHAYQLLGHPGWRIMSIDDAEQFAGALDALMRSDAIAP